MANAATKSQSLKRPNRAKWVAAVCAAVVLGAIALDTTVVRVGSEADVRQAAFDPDRYGVENFPRIRDLILERAPDAVTLANAMAANKADAIAQYGTPTAIGGIMPVRVVGVVGEGRSGVYELTVDGMPEGTKIRVQSGPAINGTDLRDFPGDIVFGQFTNQIEFQDAGSGINRAMSAEALTDLDRDTLSGKTIEVVGAFTLINPKNWLITPVSFEVK